jgi:hypothetical protein
VAGIAPELIKGFTTSGRMKFKGGPGQGNSRNISVGYQQLRRWFLVGPDKSNDRTRFKVVRSFRKEQAINLKKAILKNIYCSPAFFTTRFIPSLYVFEVCTMAIRTFSKNDFSDRSDEASHLSTKSHWLFSNYNY